MKNNKGFTLVEIIISIAILSVLCVIFLQLFVKASDISDAGHDLDESVTLTNSTLELIKNIGSLTELVNSKYFDDFEINETTNGIILSKTFNESFKYDVEDVMYLMTITLDQNDLVVNSNIRLYQVTCEVRKEEDQSILYEATSKLILE